jgi:ABC-2 type transport system permease protein
MRKRLFTVLVFARLATKRFFRDRLALFFGILFPVLFLFVFGAFSSNSGSNTHFNVALINYAHTPLSREATGLINHSKTFKVNTSITTVAEAKSKLNENQLDGLIILPINFGKLLVGGKPTGTAQVYYTINNIQAGQTLTAVLSAQFSAVNRHYVSYSGPLKVNGQATANKSLTPFDYTFAGLLGFSIAGIGIFGPVNVFPELKKQGILRRLHTTPLKVWQYFTATMIAQAITGMVSLLVMFVVAIAVFHLKVTGNYLSIALFMVYSIIAILGIGLAIGGWAKNERQAAPLSNIVVFPMLFLSGTFFPRYLMPHWLQTVSTYLPLTPVIDGARLLTTEGYSLLQIGPQIGLLTGWIIIIYFIAFRVFQWE